MYFQLVVVVLFAARCLANNHITDDCGVFPSVTQFVENRLNSSIATENVTIDFEASLCYSSRSCYGDIEPSEFSGEEELPLQLCPQFLDVKDQIHFEFPNESYGLIKLDDEINFANCVFDGSSFSNSSPSMKLSDHQMIDVGVNYFSYNLANGSRTHCLDGQRIKILATDLLCVFNGTTCSDHGLCIGEEFTYRCKCNPGFDGLFCEKRHNLCYNLTCENGGSCQLDDEGKQAYCVCTPGFTGADCTTDVNECESQPCFNGGICVNGNGSYKCFCKTGFQGSSCELETNECDSIPCLNNGTCIDGVGYFSCLCPDGFTGTTCQAEIDECQSNPCENNATCLDLVGGFKCLCPNKFTGPTCSILMDVCKYLHPCENNGTCIAGPDDYLCFCNHGYTGGHCPIGSPWTRPCQDECRKKCTSNSFIFCPPGKNCTVAMDACFDNSCSENGTLQCRAAGSNYTCDCKPGYTGQLCSEDVNECEGKPCQNEGNCTNLSPGYKCECLPGFSGTKCEIDTNECDSNPCHEEHGVCVDGVNQFLCYCENGFEGSRCEHDIDECRSSPCQHGSTCVNLKARYECLCRPGFTGINCEIDINECESSPCKNSGRCKDLQASYLCECLPGYTGTRCENELDECFSNPCLRGGTCVDLLARYECECPLPYKGVRCEKLPCDDPNPCYNQGSCVNKLPDPNVETEDNDTNQRGYECLCPAGFGGPQCLRNIDECSSNPCNTGMCVDGINKFTCLCPPGISGIFCEKAADDCIDNQCENNSTCVDLFNTYRCECGDGWTGEYCERERDYCAHFEPCLNGGKCISRFQNYTCVCAAGYRGRNCSENVNECDSSPCLNGGTCQDAVNNYTCICAPLFTGTRCQLTFDPCSFVNNPCLNDGACVVSADGATCECQRGFTGIYCGINVDECSSSPCLNGGKCWDGIDGYVCRCLPGYIGENCELGWHPCDSSPCLNRGTCVRAGNAFLCECDESFMGPHCEFDVDECKDGSVCLNGAGCTNSYGSYKCHCLTGFYGINCQFDVDECWSNPCQHGGTCQDFPGYFKCGCSPGYTGTFCETNIDDCEGAMCNNNSTCVDMVSKYQCICTPGWTGYHCDVAIDYCSSDPCKNGGECHSNDQGYFCICEQNFTGDRCQFSLAGCDIKEGTECMNNGTCKEGYNSENYCSCLPGFTGSICEIALDDCWSSPCMNNGTCETKNKTVICSCLPGFTGQFCDEKTEHCDNSTCLNGGRCRDYADTFKCFCKPGFHGDRCQHSHEVCWSQPCLNGGTCVADQSSFACLCPEGFGGFLCDKNVSEVVESAMNTHATATEAATTLASHHEFSTSSDVSHTGTLFSATTDTAATFKSATTGGAGQVVSNSSLGPLKTTPSTQIFGYESDVQPTVSDKLSVAFEPADLMAAESDEDRSAPASTPANGYFIVGDSPVVARTQSGSVTATSGFSLMDMLYTSPRGPEGVIETSKKSKAVGGGVTQSTSPLVTTYQTAAQFRTNFAWNAIAATTGYAAPSPPQDKDVLINTAKASTSATSASDKSSAQLKGVNLPTVAPDVAWPSLFTNEIEGKTDTSLPSATIAYESRAIPSAPHSVTASSSSLVTKLFSAPAASESYQMEDTGSTSQTRSPQSTSFGYLSPSRGLAITMATAIEVTSGTTNLLTDFGTSDSSPAATTSTSVETRDLDFRTKAIEGDFVSAPVVGMFEPAMSTTAVGDETMLGASETLLDEDLVTTISSYTTSSKALKTESQTVVKDSVKPTEFQGDMFTTAATNFVTSKLATLKNLDEDVFTTIPNYTAGSMVLQTESKTVVKDSGKPTEFQRNIFTTAATDFISSKLVISKNMDEDVVTTIPSYTAGSDVVKAGSQTASKDFAKLSGYPGNIFITASATKPGPSKHVMRDAKATKAITEIVTGFVEHANVADNMEGTGTDDRMLTSKGSDGHETFSDQSSKNDGEASTSAAKATSIRLQQNVYVTSSEDTRTHKASTEEIVKDFNPISPTTIDAVSARLTTNAAVTTLAPQNVLPAMVVSGGTDMADVRFGVSTTPALSAVGSHPVAPAYFDSFVSAHNIDLEDDKEAAICTEELCLNGGICLFQGNSSGSTCLCSIGWKGTHCSELDDSFYLSPALFFTGGAADATSYLSVSPVLRLEDTFEIRMKFFAHLDAGDYVLLYIGGWPNNDVISDDYVIVTMRRGCVEFEYDLGHGPLLLSSGLLNISRSNHVAVLKRVGRFGSLSVDDELPVTGLSPGYFSGLNLPQDSSIYIGGMPAIAQSQLALRTESASARSFVGCIYTVEFRVKETFKSCGTSLSKPKEKRGWIDLLTQKQHSSTNGYGVTGCPGVMACQTNPCQNNSTCLSVGEAFKCVCHEEWKGRYCEDKTTTCDRVVCENSGTCVETQNGEYRCQCALGWTGSTCQKPLTISDPLFDGSRGSWMKFSTPNLRREVELIMEFKTDAEQGLLLYTGAPVTQRTNCDFLSVSLHASRIQLRFSLGFQSLLILRHPLRVSLGRWYEVFAGRTRSEGFLRVNRIGVNRKASQMLREKSSSNLSSLDVEKFCYVGGHPEISTVDIRASAGKLLGFSGCLRRLTLNNLSYDLDYYHDEKMSNDAYERMGSDVNDCDGLLCGHNTCRGKGMCRVTSDNFDCVCQDGWSGSHCSEYSLCSDGSCFHNSSCIPFAENISRACFCSWGWQGVDCDVASDGLSAGDPMTFTGTSHARFALNTSAARSMEDLSSTYVSFSFRTKSTDGLLMWLGNGQSSEDDHVCVGLEGRRLKVSMQLGAGFDFRSTDVTGQAYNDGTWHKVEIERHNRTLVMSVDGKVEVGLQVMVPFHQLNDAGVLFLGGFGQNRNTKRHSFGLYNDAFSGCLRHVQVGRDESPLKWNEALVVENLLPCP